jgi:hypothetical protein
VLDSNAVPELERESPVLFAVRPAQRRGKQHRLRNMVGAQRSHAASSQRYLSQAISRTAVACIVTVRSGENADPKVDSTLAM